MASSVLEDVVSAPPAEAADIERLNEALAEKRFGRLVSPDGGEFIIPETVYEAIRNIVNLLAEGDSFQLVPVRKQLTTQQAADLLNVSRPYLIKLLERDAIPFQKIGTHRRIAFEDLMRYKRERTKERRGALRELSLLAKEFGDYD
ncbi:MAG TPA: excisionase family DNA-binding protein [Chloroflexota bacterium]|nr:excisionase family DNA-binding protein [Chloroflexota bacterium]